jgi:hypothetical protein
VRFSAGSCFQALPPLPATEHPPVYPRLVRRPSNTLKRAHPPTFPLPTYPCEAAYNWQQAAGDTRGRVVTITILSDWNVEAESAAEAPAAEISRAYVAWSHLLGMLVGQSIPGHPLAGGFCESFSARLYATRLARAYLR